MKFKKPDPAQLADMLNMVIGAETEAEEAKVDPAALSHTALYIDDDGSPVATCSCTLPTAAALGCALSMIPPGGAEGMVEDKELTKTASDNLYEVMNIFSSLMMNDKSAHLKLDKVEPGVDLRLTGDGFEEDSFKISLGKYGSGELIFNYC